MSASNQIPHAGQPADAHAATKSAGPVSGHTPAASDSNRGGVIHRHRTSRPPPLPFVLLLRLSAQPEKQHKRRSGEEERGGGAGDEEWVRRCIERYDPSIGVARLGSWAMAAQPALDERLAELACPVDHTILDPAVQDSPWDFYEELHASCPVFPMPELGAVMVTKYDDVRYVLTHPELFSSSGQERQGQSSPRPTCRGATRRSSANGAGGTSRPCSGPIRRSTPRTDDWSPRRFSPSGSGR